MKQRVEIEVGQWADGSEKWGAVIHYWGDGFDYQGCSDAFGRKDTEEGARANAMRILDEDYGKDGWGHV